MTRDELITANIPWAEGMGRRVAARYKLPPESSAEDDLVAEAMLALVRCADNWWQRVTVASEFQQRSWWYVTRQCVRAALRLRNGGTGFENPRSGRRDRSRVVGSLDEATATRMETQKSIDPADHLDIAEMLTCLSLRQREAIELTFFQGLNYEEAGRVMGVSGVAVGRLRERAFERIRGRYPSWPS